MQLSIEDWMKDLTEKLKRQFGQRLLFVGLQGSYQRGEATADSDIDAVVLLDTLSFQDLSLYRDIIQHMPHSKLACGFISGKAEIQHWPSYDLFQFIHDTRAYYGSLEEIVGDVDQYAADALRVGAANLYHAACHSYLFDPLPSESLPGLCKGIFFLLQAHYFLLSGRYVSTKENLFPLLDGPDREMLSLCIHRHTLPSRTQEEIDHAYEMLIHWCSKQLQI